MIVSSDIALLAKQIGFCGPTKCVYIKNSLDFYQLYEDVNSRFIIAPEAEEDFIPAPDFLQILEYLEQSFGIYISILPAVKKQMQIKITQLQGDLMDPIVEIEQKFSRISEAFSYGLEFSLRYIQNQQSSLIDQTEIVKLT